MDSIPTKTSSLESRLQNCEEQGTTLSAEMPEHQATIEMGLKQLYDKWKNLTEQFYVKTDKLKSANEYFKLVAQTELFLRKSNKMLLEWSRKLSENDHGSDTEEIKNEIEEYLNMNKANQNEVLVRMTAAAGQIFGTAAYQKTKVMQNEQEETLSAINTILLQAINMLKDIKLKEDNKLKETTAAVTTTHHTQTESVSPPPRPPLPLFMPPDTELIQGYQKYFYLSRLLLWQL